MSQSYDQLDGRPPTDKEFLKEFHRFRTKDKKKAFALMEEMEREEKIRFVGVIEKGGKKYRRFSKVSWRTSMNFSDRVAFDIDNHDMNNLKVILDFYEGMFKKKFRVIKSKHGFHLIMGEPYEDHLEWQYDACRVLYPLLERKDLQKYIEEIESFYVKRKEERDKKELTRKELQELTKDFEEKFKVSGLYFGVGNFEILFSVNAIIRDFYSIRISKKGKKDNPKEILL